MAEDITDRLTFYGRYASETQGDAALRKNEEREEARLEITRLRSLLQEAVEALEKLFSDSDESDFQDDGFDSIHVGWRDYKKIRAVLAKARGAE